MIVDLLDYRCRQEFVLGRYSIQTQFQGTGIDAKDIEEQPQANLDVFGVYAVIRQRRNNHKETRLSMLGVIDTEHISRCCFPR